MNDDQYSVKSEELSSNEVNPNKNKNFVNKKSKK